MIDAATLIAAAAELFDVECEQILAHTGRGKRLTQARQAIAYILRKHDFLLMEIGALMRRDHTTIIYSVRQAERRASEDGTFAARLRALEAAVGLVPPVPLPDLPTAPPTHKPKPTMITAPLRLALHLWGVTRASSA